MSSPSAFHGGDVASAIASARASARPLLIALHPGGDDARSASLDAVWADEDVRGELGDHWVAVRLEASTAAHRNFAQIYPAHASRVPSVVALDPNDGSVLFASGDGDAETSSLGVGTNAEATCGRLRETRAAFQKAMAAAAMAALARMAAASGAASASAAQTAPPAATQAATPTRPTHLISPSASDAAEATPSPTPSSTRRDDSSDALTTSPFPVEPKKDVETPKEEEREKGKERDTNKEQTEKTSKRDEECSRPVTRTRSASFAARVTTPDGKTTTCELPPDATLRDFRAFVATLMRPLKDTSFEIWNAWPRERVDAGVEEDKTLESLGLGGRPSLLVVLPSSSRDQGKKSLRRLEKKGGAAGAAAGGVLAVLAELIRRVWATLAMFLGIGDAGPLASGGGGETPRAEAAFGTQDAAWAAATRGVAVSAPPAAPAARARGGGARGNVHTLGSSRDDDSFSDDRANRFDNGNSTVWGGDEGGDDGHTDAF